MRRASAGGRRDTFLGRRGGQGGGMGGMGGPGGPMGMLQPKSKIQMEPKTGVTFDDVAGCDASKLELEEVVDFLSNPDKFTKVRGGVPGARRGGASTCPLAFARDAAGPVGESRRKKPDTRAAHRTTTHN